MTLPETFNPRSTHWPRGLDSCPVPLIALCSRQTGFHTVLVSSCPRALAYATLMPSPLALRLRRIFLFLPRGPAMAAPEASCPGSTCDRRCRCDVLRLPSTQPRPPAPVGLQTAPGPEVRGFSTAAHGRGWGGVSRPSSCGAPVSLLRPSQASLWFEANPIQSSLPSPPTDVRPVSCPTPSRYLSQA